MIYLFSVTVKENFSVDDYAESWLRASKHIQRLPGALGTRLHRKIGSKNSLLAVASWESKELRDSATRKRIEEVEHIIAAQEPFVTIKVIGEFEDAEWLVIPKNVTG